MKQFNQKLKLLFLGICLLFLTLSLTLGKVDRNKTIVIGAKNCTEQHILSEMLAQLVEKHTDYKVKRCFNLEGTLICFNALKSKTIDVYFEYTGTILLEILKEPLREKILYPHVKKVLQQKHKMLLLDPLALTNQYVLITRPDTNLTKISDIKPQMHIAFDPEFAIRKEKELLQTHYPQKWEAKLMDQVLLYFSLKNQAIDVMSGFSTDGRLVDPQFVVLEDDRKAFPSYVAAPLLREEVLEKFPEMAKVCALLKDRITSEEMKKLNHAVEFEGQDISALVHTLL